MQQGSKEGHTVGIGPAELSAELRYTTDFCADRIIRRVGVHDLPCPLHTGCLLEAIDMLGRVDELFDDNPHGNELNQSQKGLAQFLIPRGNASKLLEVVEEPFNLLT